MKNKIFLLVISIVTIFSACKKGDEDPFFSVYSREKRLSGVWKVDHYYYTYEEIANQVSFYKHIKSCTSEYFVENYMENGHTYDYNGSYSKNYIIDKNGTYKINETMIYSEPFDTIINRTEEGNWYFVNKNKSSDFKNKEILAFQPCSIFFNSTYNYTMEDYTPFIYEIVKLKNKEVKLKRTYSYSQDSIVENFSEEIRLLPK